MLNVFSHVMSSQRGSPKCGMPKQGAIQPMLRFHSLQALSRQLRQLLLLPGVSSLFWCCTYVLCVLCVLLYSCGDTTHANALYTTKVRPMLYTNALRMHYQCTLYCTRYTIHDTLPGIHYRYTVFITLRRLLCSEAKDTSVFLQSLPTLAGFVTKFL